MTAILIVLAIVGGIVALIIVAALVLYLAGLYQWMRLENRLHEPWRKRWNR